MATQTVAFNLDGKNHTFVVNATIVTLTSVVLTSATDVEGRTLYGSTNVPFSSTEPFDYWYNATAVSFTMADLGSADQVITVTYDDGQNA